MHSQGVPTESGAEPWREVIFIVGKVFLDWGRAESR